MSLTTQIILLFVLALPVACVSWTVTHEEIFREIREFFERNSKKNESYFLQKFSYMFTCEYCFSHYVTIAFLFLTRYTLLFPGWKGYVLALFSIVWVANIYMSLFGLLRTDLKKDGLEAKVIAEKVN